MFYCILNISKAVVIFFTSMSKEIIQVILHLLMLIKGGPVFNYLQGVISKLQLMTLHE